MHDEKYVFLYIFLMNFDIFWMCVVVVCDDLVYEWGVSAGGFQSICCCFCTRVFMNDIP